MDSGRSRTRGSLRQRRSRSRLASARRWVESGSRSVSGGARGWPAAWRPRGAGSRSRLDCAAITASTGPAGSRCRCSRRVPPSSATSRAAMRRSTSSTASGRSRTAHPSRSSVAPGRRLPTVSSSTVATSCAPPRRGATGERHRGRLAARRRPVGRAGRVRERIEAVAAECEGTSRVCAEHVHALAGRSPSGLAAADGFDAIGRLFAAEAATAAAQHRQRGDGRTATAMAAKATASRNTARCPDAGSSTWRLRNRSRHGNKRSRSSRPSGCRAKRSPTACRSRCER